MCMVFVVVLYVVALLCWCDGSGPSFLLLPFYFTLFSLLSNSVSIINAFSSIRLPKSMMNF